MTAKPRLSFLHIFQTLDAEIDQIPSLWIRRAADWIDRAAADQLDAEFFIGAVALSFLPWLFARCGVSNVVADGGEPDPLPPAREDQRLDSSIRSLE